MKTIPRPQGHKTKLFAQHQEAIRKDVDHTFGVLQSWFMIVHGLAYGWSILLIGEYD